MNSATGRESTPTRRIWTTVSPPQVATSGRARAMSDTKWPKRPTAWTARQPDIQPQRLSVTWLQRGQRGLDLVRQEAVHRLVFRVGEVLGDEALDQRPVAVGVERRVESHVPGVEGGE